MKSIALPIALLSGLLFSSCAHEAWIKSREGALLVNVDPEPGDTVSWSGGRDSQGHAHGYGTAVWGYRGGRYEVWEGPINHGRSTADTKVVRPRGPSDSRITISDY